MFSDYLHNVYQTPENPNFDEREELDRHIQTNKQLYTPSTDINREIAVGAMPVVAHKCILSSQKPQISSNA